jgi:hypothetical protein
LLLRGACADQVTDDHEAGCEPNADLNGCGRGHLGDALDQGEPGTYRPLGLVLMGLRVAEIDENPIAHILPDKPGEAADRLGDTSVIRGDDLPEIFRIDLGGGLGRADEAVADRGDAKLLEVSAVKLGNTALSMSLSRKTARIVRARARAATSRHPYRPV